VTRSPDENHHLAQVQRLFLEHQPALRSYVLSIVRDFALVPDVVQETFLAVTRKAGEFDLTTHFLAWACAIARFESLAAMRRANRPALGEETLELLAASEASGRPDYRADWLNRCLARLTPTIQRMIRLRYEDALKPGEIATLIGWTPNAVCVATSRARKELRHCIASFQASETLS
jgi:RNA polymerase sigma-70 factor (ECF subfamily)